MPRIALTKDRLLAPALGWLEKCGFDRTAVEGRSLRLSLGRGWEAVLLKGADVPTFVSNGAADVGIVGSDILDEVHSDVFELCAPGFGRCRLSLAAPLGWIQSDARPLRVATKYPRTAARLLQSPDLPLQVIKVSSSAELAPGLAQRRDRGSRGNRKTLEENGLLEMRCWRQSKRASSPTVVPTGSRGALVEGSEFKRPLSQRRVSPPPGTLVTHLCDLADAWSAHHAFQGRRPPGIWSSRPLVVFR